MTLSETLIIKTFYRRLTENAKVLVLLLGLAGAAAAAPQLVDHLTRSGSQSVWVCNLRLPHDLAALSQRLQSFLCPPGQKDAPTCSSSRVEGGAGGARRCILGGAAAYAIPIYHLSLFFGGKNGSWEAGKLGNWETEKWEIYVRAFLTQHLTRKADGAKSEVDVKGIKR